MAVRTKHIVFSLVPVLLLLLALAGTEAVLRALDVAAPPPLVTEAHYDGITWYQINRAYLAKYFPGGMPIIPEFKSTLFRKEKTPGLYRIMCLGSSSMFGTPYDMNATIPGIVRKQLRHCYPGVEFEVINWGASAINSNVVRDFAPQLLAFRPDLVLIYMGHNEYYGPDGVGASFLEKHLPAFTRWKYALRDYRLMRLLMPLLQRRPDPASTPTNLMQEVSQGQLVRSGSDDDRRVLDNFEQNLRSVVKVFRDARVPVMVGEVASNLVFAPFVADSLQSGSLAGLAWEMRRKSDSLHFGSMLETLGRLVPADTANAAVLYWRGVALRGLGRSHEALACLQDARDADLLKFRAPTEISRRTRRVCQEEGISVFSGDSSLSAWSPDGIAGDTLFWEHLHPTALGYYVLASAYAGRIMSAGYLPGDPRQKTLLPFVSDSLSLCWLDLAYGEYSIRHLTGHWPFEHYMRATPLLDGADSTLKGIVADVHARKRMWDEGCYATATYFWRIGRARDALTTYEAMLEEYPAGFYPNYLAGSLMNSLGRTDEAVGYYRKSIASNAEYPRARLDLGLILVNRGDNDEARIQLDAVLQRSGSGPEAKIIQATAHYGLAALQANLGNIEGAQRELDQALALVPAYSDALRMRKALRGF